MKWAPRGFGGERRPPEHIKREGWQAQRVLVIEADDCQTSDALFKLALPAHFEIIRVPAAQPRTKPKALNCPSCGSAIELRAMGAAAAVVCSYCSVTLDATNPQLVILQRFQAQMTVQPLIPLGSRGKLFGGDTRTGGACHRPWGRSFRA